MMHQSLLVQVIGQMIGLSLRCYILMEMLLFLNPPGVWVHIYIAIKSSLI